ncbi:hypothetical protein [Candidatus Albibeggiatoa sp. nov. BB20]|uniref:hypothetical protein n=1 Tax=Candidatus Albibeggiatoa sp. nov. BB20 TaxID=3162723 RepID=UPI003365996E
MNLSVNLGQQFDSQFFDLSFEKSIFKTVMPAELFSVLHALPNLHQHFDIESPQFQSCDFALVYLWSPKCALWEKYSPILGKYYHELYEKRRGYYPLIIFCDVYEHPEFTQIFQKASNNLIIVRNSPIVFSVKKFDLSQVSLPPNIPIHDLVFLQTMIGCVQTKAIDELIHDTERFTTKHLLSSQLIKDYIKQQTV